MNYNLIYFSPTGTTKKIVKIIGNGISPKINEFDITLKSMPLNFNNEDFVIFGIPVYSGRVPQLAKEKIMFVKGNNTPATLVASYGNRNYDDSLLELKNIVQQNGFLVTAAAAFSVEHSVIRKFGAGRPDEEDIKSINKFAESLKKKIALYETNHTDLKIKGNPEYRKYKTVPFKPHANSACVKCGICSKNCPANAIFTSNPKKTDKSKCVTCMRCVSVCPQKARDLYTIEKFIAGKKLKKHCQEYKKPEIFI